VRFAFETVTWGRRLNDIEFVLDAIAACGYQGVEFAQSPEEIFVRDSGSTGGIRPLKSIDELLSLMQARKLQLVSLTGGTLRRRMSFCGHYRPAYLYVENWDAEAETAVTMDPPFTLGLHPHWFMRVQRLSEVARIFEGFDRKYPDNKSLKILPDTALLTIVEDDPVVAVRQFKHRLAGVHLKDWAPSYGRMSPRYARGFVSLGQGIVNLEAVLSELDNINFQGWVVVEQDSSDVSPEMSAYRCADWLFAHRKMPQPDEAGMHRLNIQGAESSPRPSDAVERELDLLQALVSASTRGLSSFYQSVVETFQALGDSVLVKLYSYYSRNDELYLTAVAGLPGHSFEKVVKADSSLCGEVTRSQTITEFNLDDPVTAERFGDQALLKSLKARRMITVPLFNPSNPHQLRFLLNIFQSSSDSWGSLAELAALGLHVTKMADHVADDICSAAAARTSYECGSSKTKKEFLEKIVWLVQQTFNCEGVTVFLVNETGDRLELGATTGIEWSPTLKPHERYYSKGMGLTGLVWATRELYLLSSATKSQYSMGRSRETGVDRSSDQCLFAPLARLGGEVVGVIRLFNKRPVAGLRTSTMFTDDDASILDSIIQAALPHLELLTLQERQVTAVSRMVHEFQVPMVAIRAAVDFMQHALQEKHLSARDLFGQDYLADVLQWSQLMGRLANNANVFSKKPGALVLRATRTLLKSEVVAPAVNQVELLLKERGFSRDSISFSDFSELPPLWIDRHQFQQVFFNLLSNAIKYADKKKLRVRIETGQVGSGYRIWFSDWGVGIDNGTEEMIFQPGFRGTEATRMDHTGQGIGLHVVRTIVEAHRGTVQLASSRQPTTFEIHLPVSLRHASPRHEN